MTKAYVLGSKATVKFKQGDAGVDLELPGKALDAVATVVVLETK